MRRRAARLLPVAVALAQVIAGAGCERAGDDPARRCTQVVWFRPQYVLATGSALLTAADVDAAELVGSWDGWARPGRRKWYRQRTSDGTEWRGQTLVLPSGRYQYGILVGDLIFLDDNNPQTAFTGNPFAADAGASQDPLGTEVSQIDVPDCADPLLEVTSISSAGSGTLDVAARFSYGTTRRPLDPQTLKAELRRAAEVLPAPTVQLLERRPDDSGRQRIAVHAAGLEPGKYTVTLTAADEGARQTQAVLASAFVAAATSAAATTSLAPPPLADGLLYEIMIDRFRGAAPLAPPATPGAFAGGTLDGVRVALEAGYFDRLGVTTLWITPVYQNPDGWYAGSGGHLYEAYHGYWPAEPRSVDPRFGGEAALDALMAAAHARGVRVILDIVPNHVYQTHPYYLAHSRAAPDVADAPDPRATSWFNDGSDECVCGVTCGWGETCWFASYLPDLNWRQPDARAAWLDDLTWWLGRFDLDGVRIDAVPLMPRAATRAIARALRATVHREGLDSLVTGEVFTGPGESGRTAIRSYLGLGFDGLDSAFDFPLMWALRDVVAHGTAGFVELEQELVASTQAWSGSGAVMGHMIDNHDTSRFVSEAAGDGDGDPWSQPAQQPVADEPYQRTLLALAYILTLPGLPVLYYGDEIGLAGAGDPDNRRVLPEVLDPSTLAPPQQALLDAVGRLGRLRRCLPALRAGSRRVASIGDDSLVFVADAATGAAEDAAIVVLSRSPAAGQIDVSGLPVGHFREVFTSRLLDVGNFPTEVKLDPLAVAVYIAEGSPCAE